MKSNECCFVPESLIKELTEQGLKIEKGAPSFAIGERDGVLVSEDILAEFVKATGIRLEKTSTDFDGIFQLLGYIPKAEPVEAVGEGKGVAAVAGENPKPAVVEFKQPASAQLKTKLRVAIAALEEVCKEIA